MGSGCIDPHFLELGTSWWVVNFMLRSLYPRGKNPRYPLDRRLDNMEKRRFLTLPELELDPSVVQPTASRYNDYAPLRMNNVLRLFIPQNRLCI
jgi:hypothetical protein